MGGFAQGHKCGVWKSWDRVQWELELSLVLSGRERQERGLVVQGLLDPRQKILVYSLFSTVHHNSHQFTQ